MNKENERESRFYTRACIDVFQSVIKIKMERSGILFMWIVDTYIYKASHKLFYI